MLLCSPPRIGTGRLALEGEQLLIRSAFIGLAAAVGVLSSIGHAAPAHADDVAFLSDLKENGFENDDGNGRLIVQGHGVCNELAGGASSLAIAKEVFEGSQMDSMADSEQFVGIAIKDLCPSEGS
jgi:uncharacterized protein DUF732